MKYVITGAAGNVSKPLAEKLLKAGHRVTVIGRNPDHLKPLVEKGAEAAIGSFEDVEFLKKTFAGADAVYTMVAPPFTTTDMKSSIAQIGNNYVEAIKATGIKYIMNLSSLGAHLPDGCGPVSGLYRVEQAMNALTDVNILHLRPVFFYQNFLSLIGMIKTMGIMGGNYGGPGFKMELVDPSDIANAAFDTFNELNFSGHSHLYIASDVRSTDEIARIIGAAIGKPDLPWVVFTDEQTLGGLIQLGLPEEFAKNYVEMGRAMQSGIMMEDFRKNPPQTLGKTKLEDFAKVFAAVYNSN
jgi:uncharacterized protein YbjT (DUF2867 family)